MRIQPAFACGVTNHSIAFAVSAGGRERPHDEPAVVVVAAAVEQFELAAAHGFDRQVIQLGLRRDLEPLAASERGNFAGAAGLTLEHGGGLTELVRLAKHQSREQLEIESHLADPLFGDGRVEIDADANRFALRAARAPCS